MTRLLVIILPLLYAMFAMSCGQEYQGRSIDGSGRVQQREEDPRTITGIGAEFEQYYLNYESDCDANIGDIPIQFGTLTAPAVGTCYSWSGELEYREILIDRTYWFLASESERTWLIYHELGHCLLGRDHIDSLDSAGNPDSIMLPYIPGGTEELLSGDSRSRYIDELCLNN
jgi:hypothetical protein